MNTHLRFTSQTLRYIADRDMPEARGKWVWDPFSENPEPNPHQLHIDDVTLDAAPDKTTHIACPGVVRIRIRLQTTLHIVAHTIVFEQEPDVDVHLSCHTLVLYGPGSYYPKLKFPPPSADSREPGLRYLYSLGSTYPFITLIDIHIFAGPLPIQIPDTEPLTGPDDYPQTPLTEPFGLTAWHLIAIQALTLREAIQLIDTYSEQEEIPAAKDLKTLTARKVRLDLLLEKNHIPTLESFRFLPPEDLNVLFSNRSISELCSIVAIPLLNGYYRLDVIDHSKLYRDVIDLIQYTKDMAILSKNPDPRSIFPK